MGPKTTPCIACKRQYSSTSIHFHEKSCFKKNEFMKHPCKICGNMIRLGLFRSHRDSCTTTSSENNLEPMQTKLPDNVIGPIEPDGRVRCVTCSRGFCPTRIGKHQSICQKSQPRKSSEKKVKYTKGNHTCLLTCD